MRVNGLEVREVGLQRHLYARNAGGEVGEATSQLSWESYFLMRQRDASLSENKSLGALLVKREKNEAFTA